MARGFFKKTRKKYDPFTIKEGEIDKEKIGDLSKEKWVENVWTVSGAHGLPSSLNEFLGTAVSLKKIKFAAILLTIGFLIILFRVGSLQLIRGGDLRQKAEDNRLRIKPVISERGIIFDRNLTPLVSNIPSFNLVFSPKDLPKDQIKRNNVLEKIARIADLSKEELKQKTDNINFSSFQSVNLKENLNYDKAISLFLESADLQGVDLEQVYTRFYLFSPDKSSTSSFRNEKKEQNEPILSLSHILGYLGKINQEELKQNKDYLLNDYIGKTGLEKKFEKDLRGAYGFKAVEIDALGKEKNTVKITPPQTGKDLVLTIDVNYQKKLEEILNIYLKKANKYKAAAIVLDPNSGEILAAINIPSFNNNLFFQGISAKDYDELLNNPNAPLFSRAWSGTYPSGSTIKQIIAAAALNEKIITKNTTVLSSGGIQVESWFFPDWKAGGHGATNVIKALAESVNTFFYYMGGGYKNFTGLGLEKMVKYFKLFNLGSTLGLDVPGEATGFVPSREWKEKNKNEKWYIGDTYNLSIGQGDLLVTPLQIAAVTAAVANGGVIYQPHFVKRIGKEDNKKTTSAIKKIASNIIPDAYLSIVRQGMRSAVSNGSARFLSNLPIKVAGKTGTAQWSKKAENHAWFTSFAPYDKPNVVLTILVEEGGDGSSIAVPIAKDFYAWLSNQSILH